MNFYLYFFLLVITYIYMTYKHISRKTGKQQIAPMSSQL